MGIKNVFPYPTYPAFEAELNGGKERRIEDISINVIPPLIKNGAKMWFQMTKEGLFAISIMLKKKNACEGWHFAFPTVVEAVSFARSVYRYAKVKYSKYINLRVNSIFKKNNSLVYSDMKSLWKNDEDAYEKRLQHVLGHDANPKLSQIPLIRKKPTKQHQKHDVPVEKFNNKIKGNNMHKRKYKPSRVYK